MSFIIEVKISWTNLWIIRNTKPMLFSPILVTFDEQKHICTFVIIIKTQKVLQILRIIPYFQMNKVFQMLDKVQFILLGCCSIFTTKNRYWTTQQHHHVIFVIRLAFAIPSVYFGYKLWQNNSRLRAGLGTFYFDVCSSCSSMQPHKSK